MNDHFVKACQYRNIANSLICTEKGNYIKTQLNQNLKIQKTLWRIIKDLTSPKIDTKATARFIDPLNNAYVANFLNHYFINIVRNLNIPPSNKSMLGVYHIEATFIFTDNLLTEEIVKLVKEIDVNKSSCVESLSSKICKVSMLAVPDKVCYMITKLLETPGEIPLDWTKGVINVIPKDDDLLSPSNWRPITQTPIFAKILKKIVNVRLLNYFLDNNILSEYQFSFVPGRSTQLAVFELVIQIYLALNNNKLFAVMHRKLSTVLIKLFAKMTSCGLCNDAVKWFRNYFSHTQCVKLNDIVSDVLPVSSEIGQGTILGPLVIVFLY